MNFGLQTFGASTVNPFVGVTDLDVSGSALTTDQVDVVLQQLASAGGTTGTIDIAGSNKAPSQFAGLTAVAALEGQGRTVTRRHSPTITSYEFVDTGSATGDLPKAQKIQCNKTDGDALTTTFQWQSRELTVGAQWVDIGGATTNTSPTVDGSAQSLRCVVSNTNGSFTLTAWELPPSDDLDDALTVGESTGSVVLHADGSGNMAAYGTVTYQWYKGTTALAGETNESLTLDQVPASNGTYRFVITVTGLNNGETTGQRIFSGALVLTVVAKPATPTFGYTLQDDYGIGITAAASVASGGHWTVQSSDDGATWTDEGTFATADYDVADDLVEFDSVSWSPRYWRAKQSAVVDDAGEISYVDSDWSDTFDLQTPVLLIQPGYDDAHTRIRINYVATVSPNGQLYGLGPFTYQWYTGSSGNTGSPIGGATTDTLSAPANGNYWVRITTAVGHVDSTTVVVS